jgi:tetratricopeptide (TPR) repeat protein
LALALRQYGTALMRLEEYPEAERMLRESIEIYRSLRDPRMVVRGLGYLATLLQVRGEHAAARTALLDVLEMARDLGDDRMVPTTAMNLAETEFALGDAESAARRARENIRDEITQKSPDMRACQESNLAVYLFALGKTDEALDAALAAIWFGAASGSFVALPLQHIAAIVAPADPKRAARLLGYVDAALASTGFARQHTETYTYEALLRTLRERLSPELLTQYMREGASMNDEHAVRLAGAS